MGLKPRVALLAPANSGHTRFSECREKAAKIRQNGPISRLAGTEGDDNKEEHPYPSISTSFEHNGFSDDYRYSISDRRNVAPFGLSSARRINVNAEITLERFCPTTGTV